jgi:hypothetical protein
VLRFGIVVPTALDSSQTFTGVKPKAYIRYGGCKFLPGRMRRHPLPQRAPISRSVTSPRLPSSPRRPTNRSPACIALGIVTLIRVPSVPAVLTQITTRSQGQCENRSV